MAESEPPSVALPDLDDSGAWLAGLSAASRALRGVLEAQDTLAARKARQMGIGLTDMRAIRLLDVRGPLGATELAQLLDLRPATVTTLVDRLQAAGLVERRRSTSDGRRVIIEVTPTARERSLRVWAPTLQAMDDVGHGLNPADADVVCRYLDAVARTLAHEQHPGERARGISARPAGPHRSGSDQLGATDH